MSAFRIALWTTAFCAGAGISLFGGSRERGESNPRRKPAAQTSPAASDRRETVPAAAGLEAALALTGQRGPVSIDDIISATGLDRLLRLTAFLSEAQPADLAALMDRVEAEGIQDLTVTDAIWMRWVEIDPPGALARPSPNHANWWAWAKLDPDAALAAASEKGEAQLRSVARAIAQVDGVRGMELIKHDPRCDSHGVWEGVVEDFTGRNPAAAVPIAMDKQAGFAESMNAWMEADPEAALDWARNLENGRDRREALKAAVTHISLTDPAAGLREAMTLPAGSGTTSLVADALRRLAVTDPAAARAAVESLPAGGARDRAFLGLAAGLASHDPAAAVSLLREAPDIDWNASVSRNDGQLHYYYNGVENLSGAASLAELVSAAPAEMMRIVSSAAAEEEGRAVGHVMKSWLQRDPEAASGWLAAEPAGPARDAAIGALVNWLSSPDAAMPDFEAALEWAAVSRSSTRDSDLRQLLKRWHDNDPAAATAAAERIGIPLPQSAPPTQ